MIASMNKTVIMNNNYKNKNNNYKNKNNYNFN